MAAKSARWGEFTQLVPNHVLRDVNRHMTPAVVHRNRMPHHLGENGAAPAPSADYSLLTFFVHEGDFIQQIQVREWPFFQ